ACRLRRYRVLRPRIGRGGRASHRAPHARGARRVRGRRPLRRGAEGRRAGVDRRRCPTAAGGDGLAAVPRPPGGTRADARVVARSYARPSLVKWTVDTEAGLLSRDGDDGLQTTPLYSTAGFEELSKLWLKVGWNQKYVYTFS